jgi:hypothetical protein
MPFTATFALGMWAGSYSQLVAEGTVPKWAGISNVARIAQAELKYVSLGAGIKAGMYEIPIQGVAISIHGDQSVAKEQPRYR